MAYQLTKYKAAAFFELDMPTRFLTSFFPSTERDKFIGEIVRVDTVRGKEEWQRALRNKIIRASEILCRDALVTGQITLINDAETEYTGSEPGSVKKVRAIVGGKVDASQLDFEGTDTLTTIPTPGAGADNFKVQLRAYGIIAEDLAQQQIQDNQ